MRPEAPSGHCAFRPHAREADVAEDALGGARATHKAREAAAGTDFVQQEPWEMDACTLTALRLSAVHPRPLQFKGAMALCHLIALIVKIAVIGVF